MSLGHDRQVPSSRSNDYISQLADWAELRALRGDRTLSCEALARALRRPSQISEEQAREAAREVFVEVEWRRRVCASAPIPGRYPFKISDGMLVHTGGSGASGSAYRFMLLTCSWSMASTSRTLSKIDPTKTFERLCEGALREFAGQAKSGTHDAVCFGTASGKKASEDDKVFQRKVNDLCQTIFEGGGARERRRQPGAGDGGLDVVSWRGFGDGRPGQLILFAQCKTGVHWRTHLGTLNPSAFCEKYLRERPVVMPIQTFMIPWSLAGEESWRDTCLSGGLILDRCRIASMARGLPSELLTECENWSSAALLKIDELGIPDEA